MGLFGLSEAEASAVLSGARRRRYGRREVIFNEGDPAHEMHLIATGQVVVRVVTLNGDSATLDILGSGDVLGELALLPPEGFRSATAQALTATETLILAAEDFTALLIDQPAAAAGLLTLLVARNRTLNARLAEALYEPAERRLVRRLLDVAERFGQVGELPAVRLSQDDLAGLAGTTRETTNRMLSQWVDQGLIRVTRGRVELLNVPALERKAQ